VNGPQHYREAVRLIEEARHYVIGDRGVTTVGRELGANLVGMAHVHATLAGVGLAADLAIYGGAAGSLDSDVAMAWERATHPKPTTGEHHDPAEAADVVAMRAEMARDAGDDSDVTS
jgi:peptide subunit release factor 1 (eRF1)